MRDGSDLKLREDAALKGMALSSQRNSPLKTERMMNDIILKNVSKHFEDFVAVDNLSFQARSGSIFGLLGPNGAGKSTTMRMIANIFVPDSGELTIFGAPPTPKIQRRIGYLPEERGLYKDMKVKDQLIFFAKLKGMDRKDASVRIDEWLERFELTKWKNNKPQDLSKGMQQKVQFIAAAVHSPSVLILDEPFTGLDPISVSLLKDVILDLRRENKTIIFSTHQMEQVEQICDELCIINKSKKVLAGTLREVKQRYGRNIVVLDHEGRDGFLGTDLASDVKQYPNYMQIQLRDGVDSQEVLKRAMAAGSRINRFELKEPSLNEIFIQQVRGQHERDNGHNPA